MGAQSPSQPSGWTIAGAERLLATLTGVVSTRVVAKAGGEIEEVHLLTTDEVSAKQTVRNVESALLAHFDLTLDHRKISVAQTKAKVLPIAEPELELSPKGAAPGLRALPETEETPTRILFAGHDMEIDRAHRVRMRVTLEWGGERHTGEATGMNLPRARPEIVAEATLKAIELALAGPDQDAFEGLTLALDGVRTVEAFDRHYVMVGVQAITPRKLTVLVGATSVEDSPERATILATLQAADRWVRGRMS
jgi:hypothetical protein